MDADSLTLEQICKDLGILETELDFCNLQTPVQFPTDVLQTPESRPRKVAACPIKRGSNQRSRPSNRF